MKTVDDVVEDSADQIWTAVGDWVRTLDIPFGMRMTVVRLAIGSQLCHWGCGGWGRRT